MPMAWWIPADRHRGSALAVSHRIPGDRGGPESPRSVRNDCFDLLVRVVLYLSCFRACRIVTRAEAPASTAKRTLSVQHNSNRGRQACTAAVPDGGSRIAQTVGP